MKCLACQILPSLALATVAAAETRSFKRVASEDARHAPTKSQGRPIEFASVHVYWVAENDIRILTGAELMLQVRSVTHNDASKFFARECETQSAALSPKCRASARFVFDRHNVDNPTGTMKRRVLLSWDAELQRQAYGKR